MLGFGAAPAPPAPPPSFLRFIRFITTPYWPHRYGRTFCSCKNYRCRNTATFVCHVDGTTTTTTNYNNRNGGHPNNTKRKLRTTTRATCSSLNQPIALIIVAVMVFSTAAATATKPPPSQPPSEETLSNIPQMLSGECASPIDCKKARIQRPKSRKAESCTIKCVTTCIRGGAGSPGEGPLNARRPLVVFKQGFRSRHYCLVECSDICNLIKDGEDGP
ncbi:uncharacterized protein LOC122659282 [Telopea speciosissima]|uniref:uncharacterized protein LOC122659282 n=1 Tax=Telopea speciosissima TaxID=54955 RepID=UPI001CC6F6A7|nr:uncharacterized protein LOC122659282 [Telopea speciosissima]